MNKIYQHIVNVDSEAREALRALDVLADSASRTLFVVNSENVLVGSITDGDIRRGLLNGLEISHPISVFMNTHFKYLDSGKNNVNEINKFRKADLHLIPIVNEDFQIVEILDLKKSKTRLALSALIMAGGRGERLRPLTDHTPKPMLQIGAKPILEHNIDLLISYGIKEIYISVRYLKDDIISYFGDGSSKGISIKYIEEVDALGTLGALSLVGELQNPDLLVMNSDILTNIDLEEFYTFYKDQQAAMALASIPYHINVPYAVLQTEGTEITSFVEKPRYTYYSNGGIYLMKFALKSYVPEGRSYNATDLMEELIASERESLVHYPLLNYWLDIGKHEDYKKAQEDIKYLKF